MATQASTIDFLLEQLDGAGAVSARKMFGEYALYYDGKVVAFVCDDQLYLKPTTTGREIAQDCPEGSPYPGAKPHLLIKADRWEDRDWLAQLIRASAAELPVPVKKTRKR